MFPNKDSQNNVPFRGKGWAGLPTVTKIRDFLNSRFFSCDTKVLHVKYLAGPDSSSLPTGLERQEN